MKNDRIINRYKLLFALAVIAVAVCIVFNHMANFEQAISLSEICPHNDTVIYDKFGSYSDYIEIYNSSDGAISLEGYYLSDDKNNKQLYEIPDVTIDPNGYVLFWAAGITDDNELLLKDSDLYCMFSVSDGDTLYLTNPGGQVVDKVKLPEKTEEDLSYSYTADGVWKITSPTPGRENANEIKAAEVVIDSKPEFSHEAGFFEEEFDLSLTVDDIPAADDNSNKSKVSIYYTLDGSNPRDYGTEYDAPITVRNVSAEPNKYASIPDISVRGGYYIPEVNTPLDKCFIVRAVCRDEKGNWGEVISKSYFIGMNDNPAYTDIAVASVITDPDNLFGYENGIYVTGKVYDDNKEDMNNTEGFNSNKPFANYFMAGKGWRRTSSIELFDTDRTLLKNEIIKLGIQGNYSTNHNQKSFALFEAQEGSGVLNGIISEGSTSLSLRAGGNKDWRATKVRDAFAQNLVKDRSVGSLRAMPVQVFVNGEYWGFYNLEERVDPGYVTANYGVEPDNMILLKYGHVLAGQESDLQEYADLVDYAATHDLSNEKDYEHMCEHIDIQNYIEYNCYEIYVGNTDSVDCNYAYWRSKDISGKPYCDGKWRWILYDTDDSSGVVEDEMSEAYVDHFTAGHWAINPLDDTLFKNLLNNQTFREQFKATFVDMADNDFSAQTVLPQLDEIESRLSGPVTASMQRFLGPEYTEDDYHTAMEVLKKYYRERRDYIVEYMYQDIE